MKKKKVEVQDHWRGELTKIRAWLMGFKAGRNDDITAIPGEDVLRQIQVAIDEARK